MSQSFACEKTVQGDTTQIVLRGPLDEDANLAECFKGVTSDVVVDLMGTLRVTAGGVRVWIEALKRLPEGTQLAFERVSVPMVEQANLFSNILDGGRVLSFLAPYFSEIENKEYTLLIDVDKYFGLDAQLTAPDFRGAENVPDDLEFDDDEEEYFRFLDLQRRRDKAGESGGHARVMA